MKRIINYITNVYPASGTFNMTLFMFRVLLSVEMIYAHGLKKIGVGVAEAEHVPNPLHLPEAFNNLFADAANLFFPVLVMLGLLTRVSVVPILAVTLTGYFVVHFHDAPLLKDTPYMYSLSYLLILVLGPGKYSLDALINKKTR